MPNEKKSKIAIWPALFTVFQTSNGQICDKTGEKKKKITTLELYSANTDGENSFWRPRPAWSTLQT